MKACWRNLCLVGAVFLSMLTLVSTCPDVDNVTMPCDLNQLDGVECTYVKGPRYPLPEGNGRDYPIRVENLKVDIVLKNNGACDSYFNITWGISQWGGRYLFLRGFLLNVSFVYNNMPRNIVRTFNLTVANWNNQDIFKTAFRHECIVPAANTAYEIRLHSLPLSLPTTGEDNSATIYYQTPPVLYPKVPRDYPTNTDVTYNWTAVMWSVQYNSALDICFFTPPREFRFTQYQLALLDNDTAEHFPTVFNKVIDTSTVTDPKICERIDYLYPGVYKAHLMPLNLPADQCVCRAGPNDCKEYCYKTELSPIYITAWASAVKSLAIRFQTVGPLCLTVKTLLLVRAMMT